MAARWRRDYGPVKLGAENTLKNRCPATLLGSGVVRAYVNGCVKKREQAKPGAKSTRACPVELGPWSLQARYGTSPNHRHTTKRHDEPPDTKRETREEQNQLGHLGNPRSRRKGPGVGPVLGPRHEELADGVELR